MPSYQYAELILHIQKIIAENEGLLRKEAYGPGADPYFVGMYDGRLEVAKELLSLICNLKVA